MANPVLRRPAMDHYNPDHPDQNPDKENEEETLEELGFNWLPTHEDDHEQIFDEFAPECWDEETHTDD
jgi:hypothetical protein